MAGIIFTLKMGKDSAYELAKQELYKQSKTKIER